MNELPKGSNSFRKLNPHLYGGKVGGLEANQPKPAAAQALDCSKPKQKGRARRMGIVVTMVVHRRRILDSDNNVGSLKPLRDAIAKSVGLDDGDSDFIWQYQQIKTVGKEGVQVTIERL